MYDDFIEGLQILRHFIKIEHLEPAHDVIEIWVDFPLDKGQITLLDRLGWFHSEEEPDKFFYLT